MARKARIDALKRRHSRRLLKLPGVSGVGVERGDRDDDYVLAVHVEDDDAPTVNAIKDAVGADAVRIVTSGKFRKQ